MQDIKFTKQISGTRISNLPSKFHALLIFWKKGTLIGRRRGKMVECGRGRRGTMRAGGIRPTSSYIVKKCPDKYNNNRGTYLK
jgi:hypothetical protein